MNNFGIFLLNKKHNIRGRHCVKDSYFECTLIKSKNRKK